MINSFQALNSLTSGLLLQQIQQEVNADNLSQPSNGVDGYLENSLQQVNSVNNPSISFTGTNGLLSVGTGASVESITRLRSSYLDSQIQQQSMVTGYNEILYSATSSGTTGGVITQISNIVNGSVNLSTKLSAFTQAWGTLASAPTNVSDQVSVVNAGEEFAEEANSEYNQLENLQLSMNGQVSQTVGQINGLTQQLASINQQLLQSPGSDQNSLLDERDYTLDQLSRLVNYNVAYGASGVATVWLNDYQLVNGSDASTLQTFTENQNNAQLTGITISNGGTLDDVDSVTGVATPIDLTSNITGGNLAGELYARNTLLQSYKASVDQVATSVLNTVNNLYSAGYIANQGTASTGSNFFSGTGAADIQVTDSLVSEAASNPVTQFVATQYTANTATAWSSSTPSSGNLAYFLYNLQNVYAGNYVASSTNIDKVTPIDPTVSMFGQNFASPPNAGTFTFDVNSVPVTTTYAAGPTGSSINSILNQINASSPTSGVYAVFNYSTQEFYIYGQSAITVTDAVGNNLGAWSNMLNTASSTIVMNNSTNPNVDPGSALNSTVSSGYDLGPNSQALLITPGSPGSFTINGQTVSWTNTESLVQIKTAIQALAGLGIKMIPVTTANGNGISLTSPLSTGPLTIIDTGGNFTAFTGLDTNSTIANSVSAITTNIDSQNVSFSNAFTSSSATLTQLNNEQDNIAGVSTGSTNGVANPGVPVATIEQQAYQSMIQYNAMLEVMQVIDQMLDSLVGISSTSSTSGIFAQESSS